MRKISALIFIILSFTVFCSTGVKGEQGIRLYINEEQIGLQPLPRLVNGSTQVPVRAYFEGFGAAVHFDVKSKEIIVRRGDGRLSLSKTDGIVYYNGTAYAPLRVMSQSFGDEIIYVESDKSIRIKSEFVWDPKYLPPEVKPVLVSAGRGTVAITFDDGPGIYTSKIIDILEKHDAGATFFVLGCKIPGNEKIIKRIADAGFEIGNHTFDHPNLLKISTSTIKSQIERTQSLIYGITGTRPFYYRPPYGAFSKTIANSIDMAMVLWSVDPADWAYKSSEPIVSNILSNVRNGSIIILHDIQYITSITLDKILTGIKNKGYQIMSVSDMLKAHNIEPEKNMIYFSSYDIR